MNGQTQVRLSLGIGIQGDREEFQDLEDLVGGWAELNKEELEEALHKAWLKWAWEYIDGCAEIIEDEDEE